MNTLRNARLIRTASVLGAVSAAAMPLASMTAANAAVPAAKYYGCTTNTDYGPVTVRIAVASGRASISSVIAPTELPKSRAINSRAVPTMKARAVAVGLKSSRVSRISNVSGATSTTRGFKGSLRSCLVKAGL